MACSARRPPAGAEQFWMARNLTEPAPAFYQADTSERAHQPAGDERTRFACRLTAQPRQRGLIVGEALRVVFGRLTGVLAACFERFFLVGLFFGVGIEQLVIGLAHDRDGGREFGLCAR